MMHTARGKLVLAALALGAMALPGAACAKDYTVTIDNMAYGKVPAGLKVGDTITWVNQDTVPHTVTARDKSFNLAVDRGAHAKMSLDKAGTFLIYCLYHPMMRSTLKVAQ
jgi:plastocyanin